jgi:hypothetical protein
MSNRHHLSKAELKYIKDEAKALENLYEHNKPLANELNKITSKNFKELTNVIYKVQDDGLRNRHLPQVFIRDYDDKQPSKLWLQSQDQCLSAQVYACDTKLINKHKQRHWSLNQDESAARALELGFTHTLNAVGQGCQANINEGATKFEKARASVVNKASQAVQDSIPVELNPMKQIERMLNGFQI